MRASAGCTCLRIRSRLDKKRKLGWRAGAPQPALTLVRRVRYNRFLAGLNRFVTKDIRGTPPMSRSLSWALGLATAYLAVSLAAAHAQIDIISGKPFRATAEASVTPETVVKVS